MTTTPLRTLILDNPPTEDITFDSDVDLVSFPSNDPTRPDIVFSEQLLTGFTTDVSTVEAIAGPVSITEVVTFPTGAEPPTGDLIRNTFGFQGSEPNGADALLGTNVGAAIDNAGGTESGVPQPFNVFFASEVTGVAGPANDFFLIDLIGDDGVDIRPLDSEGNLIGDFSLRITSGPGEGLFNNINLGDFGIVENFEITASSENLSNLGLSEDVIIDDIPLAGVAFDIEDFTGTGELTSLAGFQITPLNLDDSISSADGSIDILAIGHNTQAAISDIPDNVVDLTDSGDVSATFTVSRKAFFDNTVGFYKAAADGSVIDPISGNLIAPGEAGYQTAALAESNLQFALTVENNETAELVTGLEGGSIFAPFIVANADLADATQSEVYFAFEAANSDGVEHIRNLGDNSFGFEDLPGGGDRDFNDNIIEFNFA